MYFTKIIISPVGKCGGWRPLKKNFFSSQQRLFCDTCGDRKSLLDFISVFFIWIFGINDSHSFNVGNLTPLKLVLGASERVLISHELNKTESVIFVSFFWLGCTRRINYTTILYLHLSSWKPADWSNVFETEINF